MPCSSQSARREETTRDRLRSAGRLVDSDRPALPAGQLLERVETVAKAHGFEGITFHGLRHGAATLLLAAGVPDAVALEVMGHADTRILRHYQDVVDELKRDAAARLDALLG